MHLAQVLGLETFPESEMQANQSLDDETVAHLIQQRQAAREAQDFTTADQIRDQLAKAGVVVVDQPNGEARWYRQ